jgi:hypothetical protein
MSQDKCYEEEFTPSIIKWGILTLSLGIVLSFSPALYLWWFHGTLPTWSQIFAGVGYAVAVLWAMYFVEPISYFPVLGIPGTYLSFLSGNISNLRLPCSAVAQEAAGVKEGTKEGSIISTIAISTSIIVNTSILLFGVIGLSAVFKNLPPSILHAFDFILPAIFGAIFGQFLIRSYTLGAIALALGLILTAMKIIPGWGILFILVFGTIGIARILWEKGKIH